MITSLNNEQVKKIVSLNKSKNRKIEKLFVVEGEHLVKEAKIAGVLVESYTIDSNLEGILVSKDVMNKMSNTNGEVRQIGVCKLLSKNEMKSRVLILDKIQDPGNLGTLLRSAIAFNFETIFLSNDCVDIYNDKVIRSSQGAIFKVNILSGDIVAFINNISQSYKVYGTDVVNGISVTNINDKKQIAVILGNEGNGISEEVKRLNLDNIYIDIDKTESLNVSVAGSIIMYELGKL